MRLLDVPLGASAIVLAMDGDEVISENLGRHGLLPGDQLRVVRAAPMGGPLLVNVNGREIALGREIAHKIRVEIVLCDWR